jgi:D-sedoheptulose 7-phosphate isomerase
MSPAPIDAYTRRYVEETHAALSDPYLAQGIARVVPLLLKARDEGRTIFFFGNGGSATTASHFVVDIGKGTIRGGGKQFRCVALVDSVSTLTAWANDAEYARVFSEQLVNLAGKGDVAVAISGSGNSPNVLRGVEKATGMGGGKLRELVDIPIVVPSNSMQHIEDAHLLICHLLTCYFRDETPSSPP